MTAVGGGGIIKIIKGFEMKKVVFVMITAFLFFSCDDGGGKKEPNPYPDGVYPFEVSNVSHTQDGGNIAITWDNPSDKGFKKVYLEVFWYYGGEALDTPVYSSATGEFIDSTSKVVLLKKNSFSFSTNNGNDKFLIIKCVDRHGNISAGVRHEMPDPGE